MGARVLDGEAVAHSIRQEVASGVADLLARGKPRPKLAVILAGENLASQVYVRNKIKACEQVGIDSEMVRLEGNLDGGRTLPALQSLNDRSDVDGILVQLPLPEDADEKRILHSLDPGKDVDGLHPENVGKLVEGAEGLRPCTPSGIMELLRRSGIAVEGAHAVVMGRSNIVGKPMSMLLLHANATVTLCHSKTRDLPHMARSAEILVVAVGRPAFVTEEFVKPGATVVDVGIHRILSPGQAEDFFGAGSRQLAAVRTGKSVLVGDVHPRRVRPRAGALSPVPGGVGPLTIACLLKNTLQAARARHGLPVLR
jgi:methylenetetrahydrofolate dehydrogenase (NADP+) / methenyltetrahydrofolate cyclohydrolase